MAKIVLVGGINLLHIQMCKGVKTLVNDGTTSYIMLCHFIHPSELQHRKEIRHKYSVTSLFFS